MKKYDIVISFAGEDRGVAEEIAIALKGKGINVFYDNFEKSDLWGKDLYEHLIDVYKNKSKYCLMILSEYYEKKLWTTHERKAAQARAFRESTEYILPLKLDDSDITGILETIGYLDYRSESTESVVEQLLKKLWGDLEGDTNIIILKEKLERLYQRVMGTCDLSFMPSDHPNLKYHGLALENYQWSDEHLKDLKVHLQINAPQIDHLVLSRLTEFLDSMESILRRAVFLMYLKDPGKKEFDFVSEIPEGEMIYCFEFLQKLNVFDGYAIRNKTFYKPETIITNWLKAEDESAKYCSDPQKFEFTDGKKVFVFNKDTLRKLGLKNLKHGQEVLVHDLVS